MTSLLIFPTKYVHITLYLKDFTKVSIYRRKIVHKYSFAFGEYKIHFAAFHGNNLFAG